MKESEIRQFLVPVVPLAAQWLREVAANYQKEGRPLDAQEIPIAVAAGARKPREVRIATVIQMPAPSDPTLQSAMNSSGFWTQNAAGLTLGSVILIRENHFSNALLAHELAHVAQFELLGIEGFLQLYLEQVLSVGYEQAPMEIEARRLEKRFREP